MSRYSRQEILPEIGAHGQTMLGDAHVGIIGLGGLGSAAALYLAAAGVGRLSLLDGDRVELSNLQRQIIHNEQRVGETKASSAARTLSALNSEIQVQAFAQHADQARLDELARHCDLLLDCSDNFPTRHAVNRACARARCGLVSGAAIRLEGQLFVSAPGDPDKPCYACLYGEQGPATESCEQAGVLGPLVGIIGSAQALEAIKWLTGQGQSGYLQIFDARSSNWRKWRVPPEPDCPVCRNPAC